MHLELTPAQRAFRARVEQFAAEVVAPRAAAIDESGGFPLDVLREAAARGLTGMTVPAAWGGAGLDFVSYVLAIEAIASASATVAVSLSVTNSLVADVLAQVGRTAQKEQWLRPLASGAAIGAFALSEPDAGTDAANQQTRAVRVGHGYRITGRKVWVANAEAAAVAIVFASTRPGQRGQGVTAFLVPMDTPGIVRTARADSLGVRGLGCTDLELDIEVGDDQVLGSVDQGFRVAMWALDGGRVAIAAQALGIGQAALAEAIAYANERQAFGQPIANFQAIQWMLADMATELEAARMLTWKAAAAQGASAEDHRRGLDGQAGRLRSRAQGGRQGDADPRLGRVSSRVGRRAAVPRRSRDRDLPGHVGGSASDHLGGDSRGLALSVKGDTVMRAWTFALLFVVFALSAPPSAQLGIASPGARRPAVPTSSRGSRRYLRPGRSDASDS